jgi:DNA-binding NarL/FixJ family response regulator
LVSSPDAVLLKEVSTDELVEIARKALKAKEELRPELLQVIQERINSGHYRDRKVLGKVAEQLLILFKPRKTS